jgi:hypothetical protein
MGTLRLCVKTKAFNAMAQRASDVALAHGQTNVAEQNLELQKLYRAHRAFYEYY